MNLEHLPSTVLQQLPIETGCEDVELFDAEYIISNATQEKHFRIHCALANHASEFGYGTKVKRFVICDSGGSKLGSIMFEAYELVNPEYSREVQELLRRMHKAGVWHRSPGFVIHGNELRIKTDDFMWPVIMEGHDALIPPECIFFDIAFVLNSIGKPMTDFDGDDYYYVDLVCQDYDLEKSFVLNQISEMRQYLDGSGAVSLMESLVITIVRDHTSLVVVRQLGVQFFLSLASYELKHTRNWPNVKSHIENLLRGLTVG